MKLKVSAGSRLEANRGDPNTRRKVMVMVHPAHSLTVIFHTFPVLLADTSFLACLNWIICICQYAVPLSWMPLSLPHRESWAVWFLERMSSGLGLVKRECLFPTHVLINVYSKKCQIVSFVERFTTPLLINRFCFLFFVFFKKRLFVFLLSFLQRVR